MSSIAVPTERIRLGAHLCGNGVFEQVSGFQWPFIFSGNEFGTPGQYVPIPTNAQKTAVSGFSDATRTYSAFFDFAAGTNFAGGIKVRMAQFPYNYGEVKIAGSGYHDVFLTPAYNSNTSSVPARYDIYWDYNNNYPAGFEITIRSGTPSGFYRGISDVSNATPGNLSMRVNGHGPDGTSNSTYFQDGGSIGETVIQIPWADINAVNNIYVYFGEPIETSTTAPPTTAPPTCFAVGVQRGRNAFDACCNPITDTVYFNASSVAAATVYYGASSDCSTPFAFTQYFNEGGTVYRWQSGAMTNVGGCPNCD